MTVDDKGRTRLTLSILTSPEFSLWQLPQPVHTDTDPNVHAIVCLLFILF